MTPFTLFTVRVCRFNQTMKVIWTLTRAEAFPRPTSSGARLLVLCQYPHMGQEQVVVGGVRCRRAFQSAALLIKCLLHNLAVYN